MLDKAYEMSLLLDFYGELLTEKQKSCLVAYYSDDLSLSEIAENEGISKQAVRDMIVRTENKLLKTEEKTGLVRRFIKMSEFFPRIKSLVNELEPLTQDKGTTICRELISAINELEEAALAD